MRSAHIANLNSTIEYYTARAEQLDPSPKEADKDEGKKNNAKSHSANGEQQKPSVSDENKKLAATYRDAAKQLQDLVKSAAVGMAINAARRQPNRTTRHQVPGIRPVIPTFN